MRVEDLTIGDWVGVFSASSAICPSKVVLLTKVTRLTKARIMVILGGGEGEKAYSRATGRGIGGDRSHIRHMIRGERDAIREGWVAARLRRKLHEALDALSAKNRECEISTDQMHALLAVINPVLSQPEETS